MGPAVNLTVMMVTLPNVTIALIALLLLMLLWPPLIQHLPPSQHFCSSDRWWKNLNGDNYAWSVKRNVLGERRHEEELHEILRKESRQLEQMSMAFQLAFTGVTSATPKGTKTQPTKWS
jgi:hypothetical protein